MPKTGASGVKKKRRRSSGSGKREKLTLNPSLDKVEEETSEKECKSAKSSFGCGDLSFGVRSYLHNFYEDRAYKDPDLYEDDDYRYLLSGPYPRRRKCTSVWWKVFVWIGANFLIFGILGVLIGYLVPQKPIIIGSAAQNVDIVDRQAIAFNFNLDVCKLVGLILFCIGGMTLTVALLFPSFLYRYFEDDRYASEGFRVRVSNEYHDEPPLSPVEKSVPVSSLVKSVQPDRKEEESIVTKEGMVPYQD